MIPSTERPEARISTSFVSEITELQMSVRFVHVGKEVAEARRIFHSAARKNDVRKDFGRALLLRERAPSIWKRNPLNVGEINYRRLLYFLRCARRLRDGHQP